MEAGMARWYRFQDSRRNARVVWGRPKRAGEPLAPGEPVIATQAGSTDVAMFSLSKRDANGWFRITTPSERLAVALSDAGTLVLATPDPANPRQLWRWAAGSQLVNLHSGRAVRRQGAQVGAPLAAVAPASDTSQHAWAIAAAAPPDDSPVALQISAADPPAVPQVIALQLGAGPATTGMVVALANMVSGGRGQLWVAKNDGTIRLAENSQLLLTAMSSGAVVVAGPLAAPANPQLQQWVFSQANSDNSSGCIIINQANNNALTVSGSNAIITAPVSPTGDNPSQVWWWNPGFPLDEILAMPPNGFPAFSSSGPTCGQQSAYTWISNTLNAGNDLRAAYCNQDYQPLASDWLAELQSLQTQKPPTVQPPECPIQPTDWSFVIEVLLKEVSAVALAYGLMQNISTYLLNESGSILVSNVNGVVTALSLSSNQVVDTAMSALIEGVLYTAIEAIPEVGGVLGNVFETIWNVAAASGNTSVTNPFQTELANLKTQLNTNLGDMWNAFTDEFTTIFENQAMLLEVGTLASEETSVFSPDSLAWDVSNDNIGVKAAQGFELYAIQMLAPIVLWVIRCGGVPTSAIPVTNQPPAYAWWQYQDYGAHVTYMLGASNWNGPWNENISYPSDDILAYFAPYSSSNPLGLGVNLPAIYPPSNGWTLAPIDNNVFQGTYDPVNEDYTWTRIWPGWSYDTLLVSLVNMSERILFVTLTAQEGSVEVLGNGMQLIAPYATFDFAAAYDSGLRIVVTVGDLATGNAGASFQLHLSHPTFGDTPSVWVDSQISIPSFPLGTVTLVQPWGDYQGKGYRCGSITVPLSCTGDFSPATQQLSQLSTETGAMSEQQVVGLGVSDHLPYLFYQDTDGAWHWVGTIPCVNPLSEPVPLQSLLTAIGNSNQLQVIGLGLNDNLPYLQWQDTKGAWHWAGTLPYHNPPTSAVPFASLAAGSGNGGRLQVIGLGSADHLPYLMWLDTNGAWTWQGALSSFASNGGAVQPLQSVTFGKGSGGQLVAIGIGYNDNMP